MGRTYHYECGRCGYRAQVSGKHDRGVNFAVQTIHCRDCRALHDAVVRLRVPDDSPLHSWRNAEMRLRGPRSASVRPTRPPAFQSALNRLESRGVSRFRWMTFKPQCPISAYHRVEPWNDPGPCPKCGLVLEHTALPYRLWD